MIARSLIIAHLFVAVAVAGGCGTHQAQDRQGRAPARVDHELLHVHRHGGHEHAHAGRDEHGEPGCVCALAAEANVWCAACATGWIGGEPVRSADLFEFVDAHGHDINAASIECARCQAALLDDGFCDDCGFGFVNGRLHVSRLSWILERGHRVALDDHPCRTCAGRAGDRWCDACGRGVVGNVAFDDRARWLDARDEMDRLRRAEQMGRRCPGCAPAWFARSTCPDCQRSYEAPRPAPALSSGDAS